ncbi:MAG TPA: alkaline phosphatase family protein [Candidatus Dormibacteraeota bacterium]
MRPGRALIPVVGAALLTLFSMSPAMGSVAVGKTVATAPATTTPIKHLVVIFQENVSFDHYFATYPIATNTSGQPFDNGSRGLKVNNLANTPGVGGVGNLLTNNPNLVNPQRLDPATVNGILTCDENHNYNSEQKAFDGGAMDKFVQTVGTSSGTSGTGQPCSPNDVMKYYDGNTVTAYWNYAQQFSMSDNSFSSTFGPSSPGAINLISGNTGTVGLSVNGATTNGFDTVPDGKGGFSLIGDAQPYYDDCSTRDAVSMTGLNLGDNLNAAGLSWGWFQGGFRPTTTFATATKAAPQPTSTFIPDQFSGKFNVAPATNQGLCNAVHPVGAAVGGTGGTTAGATNYGNKDDYIPHHEPFQYYATTANPHHLAPASLNVIGTDTQTITGGVPQFNTANHQYDTSDFDALVAAINHGYLSADHLPAVSFLKAPGYQDGHPGYSDPIDEQQFVVNEINALQHTPDWSSTAVVIAYDDSDGWYDHVYSGVHNGSTSPADFLSGTGQCGTATDPRLGGQQGRCGYGPRQPLLVISPFAKKGAIDHTVTDLSSITKFAEDNWHLPQIAGSFDSIAGSLNGLFNFRNENQQGDNSKLFLDPTTGQALDQKS